MDYDYLFKIILIGDSTVGKTTIVKKFQDSEFEEQTDPTIGVEFACKVIEVGDIKIKL